MRAQNKIARQVCAVIAAASMFSSPLALGFGACRSAGSAPHSSHASACQPARSPPPKPPRTVVPRGKATIRSTVSLVEIDVQVTDRDGKPVKGLKQEQFSVTEDGKAQRVSTFEYNDIEQVETAGKSTNDGEPITHSNGRGKFAGGSQTIVHDHRMIVLFFDLTSLQPEDLLRSTRAAEKYIREQMTPADLVGIMAFGNTLKVVANFTNDRDLLEKSVEALVPGHEAALAALADAATAANGETAVTEDTGAAFVADDTEFNVFNTDRKLAAVEAICEVLDGIPGKKSLIQFTSGITQTGEENRSQLIAATNSANRSNVSIYSVDSRGLLTATPGGDASAGASGGTAMFTGATVISQSQARQDSRETLATLAGDTGGRSFFDTGDFGKIFQSVQSDTSGYYLVGYYSTNAAQDGAWRRIQREDRSDFPPERTFARAKVITVQRISAYSRPRTASARSRTHSNRSETPEVELPVAVETSRSSGWKEIRCSSPSRRSSLRARCNGRKNAAAMRLLSISPPRCATRKPIAWSARCATRSP